MTTDKYIQENKTQTFKKFDRVVMHNCHEATLEENKYKVWLCETDSFIAKGNEEVVFLKDFSGSFLVKCLKKLDFVKIPIDQLIQESTSEGQPKRFSHPAYTRKVSRHITPCDFDKDEKLIEVEFLDGERKWFNLKTFFGIVIAEANEILLINEDNSIQKMNIAGIEFFKVKRTQFMNLIFEINVP